MHGFHYWLEYNETTGKFTITEVGVTVRTEPGFVTIGGAHEYKLLVEFACWCSLVNTINKSNASAETIIESYIRQQEDITINLAGADF